MSRVATFARTFPGYHNRAGEPTHFVEKIYNGLPMMADDDLPECLMHLNPHISVLRIEEFCESLDWKGEAYNWPKWHTIRAGHRWKVGDKFSPRVWSGRPYHSQQITIHEDLTVEKVYDFRIKEYVDEWWIDFGRYYYPHTSPFEYSMLSSLACNDGLILKDFLDWFKFPKPFSGQIISWDERINY